MSADHELDSSAPQQLDSVGEITQLLGQMRGGGSEFDREVLQQLVPLVYGELKALARSNRYRWRGRRSLGTTSLVHEAYAKLAAQSGVRFDSRRQFYGLASRVMRTILIDHARTHQRRKRGGGAEPESLQEELLVSERRADELVALDDALVDLEKHEPELARIVECRCFGGLDVVETANALDISTATVKRRWAMARAWLFRHLAAETA